MADVSNGVINGKVANTLSLFIWNSYRFLQTPAYIKSNLFWNIWELWDKQEANTINTAELADEQADHKNPHRLGKSSEIGGLTN
jgi:hypothetical protein